MASRAAYMRERRKRFQVQGKCDRGCGRDALPGQNQCRTCADKHNALVKTKQDGLLAAGKCVLCKVADAVAGRTLCSECREQKRHHDKERRLRCKNEGLCIYNCGNKPVNGRKICKTCMLKERAAYCLGSRKRWKELLDVLSVQDGRCIYSGIDIQVGVNGEVDHRVPRCRGGADEIGNLQWVHEMVNEMKGGHSEEEFLGMCLKIVENNQEKLGIEKIAYHDNHIVGVEGKRVWKPAS